MDPAATPGEAPVCCRCCGQTTTLEQATTTNGGNCLNCGSGSWDYINPPEHAGEKGLMGALLRIQARSGSTHPFVWLPGMQLIVHGKPFRVTNRAQDGDGRGMLEATRLADGRVFWLFVDSFTGASPTVDIDDPSTVGALLRVLDDMLSNMRWTVCLYATGPTYGNRQWAVTATHDDVERSLALAASMGAAVSMAIQWLEDQQRTGKLPIRVSP